MLIPEKLDDNALGLLKKDKNFELVSLENPSGEVLKQTIADADALIVRSKTKVNKDLIEAGKKLQIIGRAGVGTDNIDLDYAEKRGVLVVNAPEESLDSVADLTIGLILALCRKLFVAFQRTKSGDFNRNDLLGCELRGLVLGLVGCGRIGRKVAQRAKAFGIEVIAFDPYISPKLLASEGIKSVSFNNLLKSADIISLHLPLNENTENLIGNTEFNQMKNGVYLINTSRAGIINEQALIQALEEGKVAGAGLDVISSKDPNYPLIKNSKVIISPHVGASTYGAQRNVGLIIVKEIMDVLNGNPPNYPVNFPKLPVEARDLYIPFRDLLSHMALILNSMKDTSYNKITIYYPKTLPNPLHSILTRTFLAGFLKKKLTSTEINVVNSQIIAEERDIQITESVRSSKNFKNMVEIQIKLNDEIQDMIIGYITADNKLIINRIDKYEIKFELTGHLFLIDFMDRPGMIGAICSFLGEKNINIAELQVARILHLGTQLMSLKVDQEMQPELISELRKLKDINLVSYFSFS